MSRRIATVAYASIVVMIILTGFATGGSADDGSDATVSALETKVTQLRTSVARRDDKIAELEATVAGKTTGSASAKATIEGDTAIIGRWHIAVSGAEYRDEVGKSPRQPQGIFLVVTLRLTNEGSSAAAFPFEALNLMDGDHRTFLPASDPSSAHAFLELGLILSDPLNPGIPYTYPVVFDVPDDASGFSLTTGTDQFRLPFEVGS